MSLSKKIIPIFALVFSSIVGLFFVFFVPPFQKPDEIVHFKIVSVIAGGESRLINSRLLALPEKLKTNKVAFKSEVKFDDSELWYKDENQGKEIYEYNLNKIGYISYFPSFVGIMLGNFSDMPVWALYGGRLAGLIVFIVSLWLAYKLIPKKFKNIVLVYGLMPMVLQQATEVSYDVLLFALTPIILAITLRLLLDKNHFWKYFLALVVVLAIFVLVKAGYYFVLVAVPIVLWNRYKKIIIEKPIIGIILVAVASLAANFAYMFLIKNSQWPGDKLINGVYQSKIFVNDPGYFLTTLADTWEAKREFYVQSSLGYFGWLDYKYDLVGNLIVVGILVFFVLKVFKKVKDPVLDWFGVVMLGCMLGGTYILIHFMFWMYWTNVGSNVIEGVQGRYLLPLMPFAVWWILELKNNIGKKVWNIVVPIFLILMLGIETYKAVDKRYYDFSNNLANKEELSVSIDDARKEEIPIEKISSKDKMERYFDTGDEDVVGGFQFAFEKNDKVVRVPYWYKLTNEEGDKVYRKGYLIQNKLQESGVYEQKVEPFESEGKPVKLVIGPVVVNDGEYYFDYLSIYRDIQAKLLFVTREQK